MWKSPGELPQRRTAKDFAHWLRDISGKQYPQAERIVLVMDNLNTHFKKIDGRPCRQEQRLAKGVRNEKLRKSQAFCSQSLNFAFDLLYDKSKTCSCWRG